jgi:predicted small metal-binding protein
MIYEYRCKRLDPALKCGWVATAESKDALVGKIARHAAEQHSDDKMTPELWAAVEGVFRIK